MSVVDVMLPDDVGAPMEISCTNYWKSEKKNLDHPAVHHCHALDGWWKCYCQKASEWERRRRGSGDQERSGRATDTRNLLRSIG